MPVHPVHPDPQQLAAWQAGELRGRESARIQAHVAGCAECTGVVAAVERGRSALDRLAEPDLPSGLHERLAVAIEQERVAAAEVVENGARHGDRDGAPVAEPVPLDARRARRQHRAHRAAGPRAVSHRPRRRRAALLSTAAAVILLVGGLFPLLRHITEGSGSTQTASGGATAAQGRGPAQSLPAGSNAVQVFSAPGGYSADALRSALQSDPQVRAAYDRAASGATNDRSSASEGSGQPSTVAPFEKESNGAAADKGGSFNSAVPQAMCVGAARDQAGDQSLRPAFFVDTVYQGRHATVLVTVRPGAANQADLWAFPEGNCSARPFAHDQVTVPGR